MPELFRNEWSSDPQNDKNLLESLQRIHAARNNIKKYPCDRAAHDFLVLLLGDATASVVRLQEHFHLLDDTLLHRLFVFVLKLQNKTPSKLPEYTAAAAAAAAAAATV